MSTATFPAGSFNFDRPSVGVCLTRRGRLARTLLVLSLSVVLGAGFAMNAGAGVGSINSASSKSSQPSEPKSFVIVTVAPGETLWSLASQIDEKGDVQALMAEIASANSLKGVNLNAGQKLQIPL